MSTQDQVTKLDEQIADIKDFIAYWQATDDIEQLEEAPGRIAVLETDLENLTKERKALIQQVVTYFGFYIDIFELEFCLHTEQMVVQAYNDPKSAQLRAAGFIGEDYDGTGPKPNTLHNFIESTEDYKRMLSIIEPEQIPEF